MAEPWLGPVPLLYVIGSSSTSVQVTVPVWSASSAPELASGEHSGAAFVALIVSCMFAVFELAEPSLARNVNVSEPL